MNCGDSQQGLNADIDEHHETEEYWEQRQAAKDTWVDGGIEEAMRDLGMFQEFLKESMSEELSDCIHKLMILAYQEGINPEDYPFDRHANVGAAVIGGFRSYCHASLEQAWEDKMS